MPLSGTSNLGAQIRYMWRKKIVKVNIDILCQYFSFLAYQRIVQLIWNVRHINISFDSFYGHSLSFIDRQTGKSKDQASRQYHT